MSKYIYLPIEILEIIGSYCDAKTQIYTSMVNKYVYSQYHIYSLNISNIQYFDSNILKQERFLRLHTLNCSGNNSLDQYDLCNLKSVRILNCHNNPKIFDVNHLANLEELDCSGENCGIDQRGIIQVRYIERLNCSENSGINDVNHLRELRELDCSGMLCGIGQSGISQLKNLHRLNCYNNGGIRNVNHLRKLNWLDCGCYSSVNQYGIRMLKNIKILICEGNREIYDVGHMINLKYLSCGYGCGIDTDDLSHLDKSTTIISDRGTTKYYLTSVRWIFYVCIIGMMFSPIYLFIILFFG